MTTSGSVSVPANGAVTNVVSGSIFEFIPEDSEVEIGLNQTLSGVIGRVACDSEIALEDMGTTNLLVKGTLPIYPDDFILNFLCVGGSRLTINLRNTTSTAIVVLWAVRITPA